MARAEFRNIKYAVAGGRGVKSETARFLLRELAGLIGAQVIATRGSVEDRWLSESQMVGMSGKDIYPELYLGFGVSGSNFHMAGVKNQPYIIAVNTDRKARIFEIADEKIIEDCEAVLRRLVRYLKEKQVDAKELSCEELITELLHGINS